MADNDYREKMLNQLSEIIEKMGSDDKGYDNIKKSLDILEVLEVLLAYTIYNTSNSMDTIRDSSEESYFNIKRRALAYYHKNKEASKTQVKSEKPNFEKIPNRI